MSWNTRLALVDERTVQTRTEKQINRKSNGYRSWRQWNVKENFARENSRISLPQISVSWFMQKCFELSVIGIVCVTNGQTSCRRKDERSSEYFLNEKEQEKNGDKNRFLFFCLSIVFDKFSRSFSKWLQWVVDRLFETLCFSSSFSFHPRLKLCFRKLELTNVQRDLQMRKLFVEPASFLRTRSRSSQDHCSFDEVQLSVERFSVSLVVHPFPIGD